MASAPHGGAPLTRFAAPIWELHKRPQWRSLHGGAAPFWRNLHAGRGPRGSSSESGATTRHSQLHM
eukprot:866284-Pyramimonas_sp.AAC.1